MKNRLPHDEPPATSDRWSAFALLIIDVQKDFWPEGNAGRFPAFPERMETLLRFCRQERMDIIHIHALFEPDQSDWMTRYRLKGSIPCVRGTPGAEILPFARPFPGETVLIKHTFDAFHNHELMPLLRQRGKRFLLVAGLVTSVCVLLTAASAAQNGFLTALVEDACADDTQAHEDALARYPFIFERVNVDQIHDRRAAWLEQIRQVDGSL